jgi:CheY-like chemotaxis protein
MPEYRQSIREYMRAAETLLKISEFTHEERQLLRDIINTIAADILDGHIMVMLVSTARREILKPCGDEFMVEASSIRVLLVDNHAMVRQGLRCALEVYPHIEVVGKASNGEEAIVCVAKVQPTVVVIDINMSKMDGIAATRLIKAQQPHIAVVGLSAERKDYILYSMQTAGASEVLHKKSGVVELYAAIHSTGFHPGNGFLEPGAY